MARTLSDNLISIPTGYTQHRATQLNYHNIEIVFAMRVRR